ncbi:MAG: tetratricopeptide repeat protein, partial [Nitrospirae bacterium]|nr:tetratricopeptide repeat protein [Nitrospirota bacterium]
DLALEDMDRTIGFFRDDLNQGLIWESADLSRLNMTKAYTNRANILIAMGRIEDAEQDFQRARDLVPLDFSQSLPSDDETFRLAEKYYQAGDWPNAVAALTAIIDNEPDNASAHINRANAYSSLKRYQEAIEDFNRAIELNPGVGVTYHNRGLAYAWSGMKDKAIADLAKACKLGFQPSCESADLVRRDRIGINKG